MYYIIVPSTLLIGYLIGYLISRKVIFKRLKKGTGKMGIIKCKEGFTSFIIEVEELEVAGDLTKIIIHNAIPNRDALSYDKEKDDLLKKWGGNDWVPTKEIIWYDNNSQIIRDNKINQILN